MYAVYFGSSRLPLPYTRSPQIASCLLFLLLFLEFFCPTSLPHFLLSYNLGHVTLFIFGAEILNACFSKSVCFLHCHPLCPLPLRTVQTHLLLRFSDPTASIRLNFSHHQTFKAFLLFPIWSSPTFRFCRDNVLPSRRLLCELSSHIKAATPPGRLSPGI